jgi:hypothetical protein
MKANNFGSTRRRWICTVQSRLKHATTFQRRRAVFCVVWLLLPGALQAQDFNLDWFTVAGGGGESSGGDFELSATIGQPDAGDLLGGDFAIAGGFWSIVTVVDTPTDLLLNVSVNGREVAISWREAGSAGFTLEETVALGNPSGTTAWIPVNVAAQAGNGSNYVRLPLAAGNRFYRLHKP